MKLKKMIACGVSCLTCMASLSLSSYAESAVPSYDDICTVVEDGNTLASNIETASASTKNNQGIITDYLYCCDANGDFVRVCIDEGSLYADYFSMIDSEMYFGSRNVIEMELPIFGGFFSGEEYNYCLFGQENDAEDDSLEVIRVVKYSKDWERLDSTSFYGCNTTIPFRSGTPRMYEKNGILYIHAAHTMYTTEDDGLRHQANIQIHIDTETMESTFEFFKVSNISKGYSSHSFDQYVRADDNYAYTADLGDAYPRSVVICQKNADGSQVAHNEVYPIYGGIGDNYTGVALGGFELSADNALIIGNSDDQTEDGYKSYVRNIFLNVTSKDMSSTETYWLTDYTTVDSVSAPKLTKVDDNTFIAMWNEFPDGDAEQSVCRIVKIDGEGSILEDISLDINTTECDPIIAGDEIVWYMNDGSGATSFYHLKYDNLSQYDGLGDDSGYTLGDVNDDGKIDLADAVLVIQDYAYFQIHYPDTTHLLTEKQMLAADVYGTSSDIIVNALDAYYIDKYYAYTSAGGAASFTEWLADTSLPPTDYIPQPGGDPTGGFTNEEIENSEIKPKMSVSQNEYTISELEAMDYTVPVEIAISDAAGEWSASGIHLFFDEAITAADSCTKGSVIKGSLDCNFASGIGNCFFSAYTYTDEYTEDGTILTVNLTIPEEMVYDGSYIPLNLEYADGDAFTDVENSYEAQLMQAYLFTQGMQDGYISIVADSVMGDVNTDGEFNISDVVAMQMFILGHDTSAYDTYEYDMLDWTLGDYDGDSVISPFDLAMMKTALASQ